jgi:hypothetical protein
MSPGSIFTRDQYEELKGLANERLLDITVLRKDISFLQTQLDDIKSDLEEIKGYFFKALLGIGGVVGLYLVQWILGGGLSGVKPL